MTKFNSPVQPGEPRVACLDLLNHELMKQPRVVTLIFGTQASILSSVVCTPVRCPRCRNGFACEFARNASRLRAMLGLTAVRWTIQLVIRCSYHPTRSLLARRRRPTTPKEQQKFFAASPPASSSSPTTAKSTSRRRIRVSSRSRQTPRTQSSPRRTPVSGSSGRDRAVQQAATRRRHDAHGCGRAPCISGRGLFCVGGGCCRRAGRLPAARPAGRRRRIPPR